MVEAEPAVENEPAPASAAPEVAPAAKPKAAKKATKAKAKSKPKAKKADVPAWVAPTEGAVPETHPVKVKVSSGIYHLPGMINYDRTTPDRCYRDAAAAEADGFRPARR
jgi:hypothetical protein